MDVLHSMVVVRVVLVLVMCTVIREVYQKELFVNHEWEDFVVMIPHRITTLGGPLILFIHVEVACRIVVFDVSMVRIVATPKTGREIRAVPAVNVQVTTAAMFPAVVKKERELSVLVSNALNQSQSV